MKYFLLRADEKYFEFDNNTNELIKVEKTDYYTITVDDNAVYTSNNFMITLQCQFYIISDTCPFQEGEGIYSYANLKSMGFTLGIPTFIKYRNITFDDYRTATIEALGIFDTKEEIELVKNL